MRRGGHVVAGPAVARHGDGALDGDARDGLGQADGAAKVERVEVEATDRAVVVERGKSGRAPELGDEVCDAIAGEGEAVSMLWFSTVWLLRAL